MCSSLHILSNGSPVLIRSQISCAISGVYLLGLPVFFGASAAFGGVAAPLALALVVWAVVARFDGFAAVSGMTLVLVRMSMRPMVTDSLNLRVTRCPLSALAAQGRGTAQSLCLP